MLSCLEICSRDVSGTDDLSVRQALCQGVHQLALKKLWETILCDVFHWTKSPGFLLRLLVYLDYAPPFHTGWPMRPSHRRWLI